MKQFFLAISLAFLTACGIANKIPTNMSLSQLTNDSGLLVFSVTTNETCVSDSTAFTVIDTTNNQVVETKPIFINNYSLESDFPNETGNLYVLELKPETYTFKAEVLNPYLSIKNPVTNIFFTVTPRGITYAGNLHNSSECEFLYGTGVSLKVEDKTDRDLALFLSKNPSINKADIIYRPFLKQ